MRVTDKFVFFWTKRDVFSQWYPAKFEVKGILFPNAEALMMFSKSILFQYDNVSAQDAIRIINEERKAAGLQPQVGFARKPSGKLPDGSLSAIMETDNPKVAKAQGRKVEGFDKRVWDSKIIGILRVANRAKFMQNPNLFQKLISFSGLTFVEASPYDEIYGVGMSEDHPDIEDPSKWKGENKLGYVLTELAKELS
ncbi:NADAR family protein [Vibrio sp. D431a]|uniref:NADAR family protein n=1 Tax=Vibrio sp. D431a TaxID=2837388 RepID=UPI002556CC05|nr:NADAR family protein [Vibrio sp. D431a]MDK9790177.1 NADAR family protein [Vibrio sp. D431a]